jgi:uncharacterized SAM-binding protein YcdF (DUF218 family)
MILVVNNNFFDKLQRLAGFIQREKYLRRFSLTEAMKLMTEVLTVLKGFLDPFFIVFILLIMSFVIVFRHFKKKSDTLILFFCIIFAYGAGIAPVANYLCYTLEKDYINNPVSLAKNNIDAIVVLGNGTREISPMKETFNTEFGSLRLLRAVDAYHRTGAEYFVCSGKGPGKLSEAHVLARSAKSLGVPKENIRIESESNNTAEKCKPTQ